MYTVCGRGAAKSALKLVTHVQKFPAKRGGGTAMGPMFGNSRACGPIDGKTRQFHGLLVGLNGCRLILPPRARRRRCNLSVVCCSSSLCLKCCATALHITRFCEYETKHSHTHYSSRWVHNKFILKFRFNFLPAARARDCTYE